MVRTRLVAIEFIACCALAILFSFSALAEVWEAPVQGRGRGGPFRVTCDNGYMVGFSGRVGAWIDHLQIVCATWDPSAAKASWLAGTGRLVNPRPNSSVQAGLSQGGGPASAVCPPTDFMTGITFVDTKGDGPTNVVHHITFQCQPSFNPQRFGSSTPPEARGDMKPDAFISDCPWPKDGGAWVAVGLHGRSGTFVDALGVICAPWPSAAPPPQATAPKPIKPLGKRKPQMETASVPSAEGFTGTWNTRTDKNWSYAITFIQNGGEVIGTYVAQDGSKGRIKGRLAANVMEFNWEQDGGYTGTGRFTLAADGNSFAGDYRANPHPKLTDPRYLQGTWSGTRR